MSYIRRYNILRTGLIHDCTKAPELPMSIAQRRRHMLRGIRGPNKARASKRTVGINAQADRRRTRCFEVPGFRRPLSSCH
jgi:hypothetical protein